MILLNGTKYEPDSDQYDSSYDVYFYVNIQFIFDMLNNISSHKIKSLESIKLAKLILQKTYLSSSK